MKIGKLHIGLMLTGFSVLWLNGYSKPQGTWFIGLSWANPAFQLGAITKKGFGGIMGQHNKAPNGKRVWGIGVWA